MAAGRRGGSVGSGRALEPLPALPGLAFLPGENRQQIHTT